MRNYGQSNELTHYGVLGMKWGVRKQNKLSTKAKQQQTIRSEIRNTRGVGDRAYTKASKNLYLTRSKLALQKAKNDGDKTGEVLSKNKVKDAKYVKKHGAVGRFRPEMRKIFGSTLSDKELAAVSINEWEIQAGKRRAEKIIRTIGAVSVPILSTVAIAEGKYYVTNGKFGMPSLDIIDGKIGAMIK